MVATRACDGDSVFLEFAGCVARYHAPLGRLVHVGRAPKAPATWRRSDRRRLRRRARRAAARRAVPRRLCGLAAGRRRAGLAHYRRHHCGYVVGIGCRRAGPAATRSPASARQRHELKTGMTFHVLSWLMGTGRGDFFMSDTVLLRPTDLRSDAYARGPRLREVDQLAPGAWSAGSVPWVSPELMAHALGDVPWPQAGGRDQPNQALRGLAVGQRRTRAGGSRAQPRCRRCSASRSCSGRDRQAASNSARVGSARPAARRRPRARPLRGQVALVGPLRGRGSRDASGTW